MTRETTEITRHDITVAPFNGKVPRIHSSAFIAPGCRIIGDVEIGPDVSIWYNCVIRADVHRVVIGARTNIQDGTIVHCDSPKPRNPDGFPTIIGDDVLIGHMAMIHGCTLEDRAFVGLGAIVMDGSLIESDGMLAAGAQLTGKRIGARQLWMGRPAKYARDLDDAAVAANQAGVKNYVINGRLHAEALGLRG
ncbi:Carbonic anhydrase or acetyltransferase, isoleucine patch superfamily [Novosphingobium sp. CF614]|uniref:gamma carbonic anhydrase family protein n=1 Tax=Novosphingobium sp. CF614 TaxID=1884364 RepID=UPI0008E673D3|nr:Carbonic anhydrase or acetyltransferase, isoleucine patch superfamily [Novosphingobium sp. CF614]